MEISETIKKALKEDIGREDITTNAIVPKALVLKAEIIAKEEGIIAGLGIAKAVFQELDKRILFINKVNDGDKVKKGKVIAELKGNARAILTGERVALNFLQRLSGIATLTSKFVKLAGKENKVRILDTRKTTPLLKVLEKYAVRLGGGFNHRFNLYEAILIKDNHVEIAGGIRNAMKLARKTGKKINVEVKNIEEVREALNAGAERMLLDNMDLKTIKKSVAIAKLAKIKPEIEVSGGVNLKTINSIAKTGVDFVSIGALTHSVKSLDISLEVKK